jgi:lysophospholipase
LPEEWRETRVPFGEDGFIRVGIAERETAQGTVLFVPGYTSSIELASELLAKWHEAGWEVAAMDLPGQGRSMRRGDDPQKPITGDYAFYADAVGAGLRRVASERRSAGPLILAGESFGGASVLRALHEGDVPEADGIFVMVPALAPSTGALPTWLAKPLLNREVKSSGGDGYLDGQGAWQPGTRQIEDYAFCGDREDRVFKNDALFMLNPDLRVGGATTAWIDGMLRSGELVATSDALRTETRPVVIALAENDTVVKNAPARTLCSKTLPNCTLTVIEDSSHCFYLEDDEVMDAVTAALAQLARRES